MSGMMSCECLVMPYRSPDEACGEVHTATMAVCIANTAANVKRIHSLSTSQVITLQM